MVYTNTSKKKGGVKQKGRGKKGASSHLVSSQHRRRYCARICIRHYHIAILDFVRRVPSSHISREPDLILQKGVNSMQQLCPGRLVVGRGGQADSFCQGLDVLDCVAHGEGQRAAGNQERDDGIEERGGLGGQGSSRRRLQFLWQDLILKYRKSCK
jgi:hypothetical protein